MNQDVNYWIARCASLEQELDMMKEQSIVKWHTGEPKYVGMYITTLRNGDISYDCWSVDRYGSKRWVKQEQVVAWCKLSDIEPYKEE